MEPQILKALFRLAAVPMTLDILQHTHIGKEVNALRKMNGKVGEEAKDLVKNWKQLLPDGKPSRKFQADIPTEEGTSVLKTSTSSPSNNCHVHLTADPIDERLSSPSSTSSSAYSKARHKLSSAVTSHHRGQRELDRSPTVQVQSPHSSSSSEVVPHEGIGFSSPSTRKRKANVEVSTDMVALSKRSRTQVYSGKKTITGPQVIPSLFDLSMKVLMDNIDAIEEVGGVPFYILEPILERCTALQLMRLEEFNPHFVEDSDGLWARHCQKEFKGCSLKGQTWRELYIEKLEQREKKLKAITTTIRAKVKAEKEPQRQAKLAAATRIPAGGRHKSSSFIGRPGSRLGQRTFEKPLPNMSSLKKKTMKMVQERKMMMNARPGKR